MYGFLACLPVGTLGVTHGCWELAIGRQKDKAVTVIVCLATFFALEHSYLVCGTFLSFHSTLLYTVGQSESICISYPAASLLTLLSARWVQEESLSDC